MTSSRQNWTLSIGSFIGQIFWGAISGFGGPKFQAMDSAQRRELFAVILPWLRGQISQKKRLIGTIQDDESILRFVNSVDAVRLAELGTSCPSG